MSDSSMRNIAAVESYGKNIQNVQQQMMEIFKKLKTQTDQTKAYWDDDMFDNFSVKFDQDIMKKVQEISVAMNMFAKYVEEMTKIHRMAQNQKYY